MKIFPITLLNVYFLLVLVFGLNAQSDQDYYKNPVIPGFHPDPSICRVGNDYYLVTSSFEYFPGVPFFHSVDLVHWEQIGYCLTRKSQLNLDGVRASGGIYAPTIRYHNGTFYMITTNVSHGGNFFVTAKNPAGPWSEPVWIDQTGIDPSLFFDDDGKVYYTGNTPWGGEAQGIYQFEIDPVTGAKLSPVRLIWSGTGGRYPEGPHLYKINNYYYLMIAEGGTEYGHMVTIARSKNPWGPFISCPNNPILTHKGVNTQNSPIQGTGHADLVQTPEGKWWMVCLAFRPQGGNWHHLGRETFLAPVSWKDDWPVVNDHGTLNLDMKYPGLIFKPKHLQPFKDEFDLASFKLEWNFLRNPDESLYSFREKPGWLRITCRNIPLDSLDSPGFLGRRQEHLSCITTTRMNFQPESAGQEAGLTVFMNNEYHYALVLCKSKNAAYELALKYRIGVISGEISRIPVESNNLILRIEATPTLYSFSYSEDGTQFKYLGSAETKLLSSEVAGGFTGVYHGIFASGSKMEDQKYAFFDWFEYLPLP